MNILCELDGLNCKDEFSGDSNILMLVRYTDILLESTWFLVADPPKFPREGTFSAAHERLQRHRTSATGVFCAQTLALQCRTTEP